MLAHLVYDLLILVKACFEIDLLKRIIQHTLRLNSF